MLTKNVRKLVRKAAKSLCYGVDALQAKVAIKDMLLKHAEDGKVCILLHSTDCDGTSGVSRCVIPANVVHWEKFYWDVQSNAEGRFCFEYYKPSEV